MARYELRLYMKNACGPALLGDVSGFDASDDAAAVGEARARVGALPKNCAGALFDAAGAELWSGDAPVPAPRAST